MVHYYNVEKEFIFESGEKINELKIAYTTYGTLNENKDNVIWVCHAISGDSNVLQWWPQLFGKDMLYDPKDYFIICANCIGSPFGSTSPQNFEFPNFSVRDVVNAHFLLAEYLGINSIHTLLGGSFGGYQALEFAHSFHSDIEHLVLMASSAKESAWGIAIHEAQRIALRADSSFEENSGGYKGLKAARALGMLTYRTSENLINNQSDQEHLTDDFKASSYINYLGTKFSKSFNALSLYYLTKCIDTHNIGRGRGGEEKALKSIQVPTLIIGFLSDLLVPISLQRFLAENLSKSRLIEIESDYGHDGFLLEGERITDSINDFYNDVMGKKLSKRAVLKFGGTSLYGEENIETVKNIIENEYKNGPLAVVVSARGKSTDRLIDLYELASSGQDYSEGLAYLHSYLSADLGPLSNSVNNKFEELRETLQAIKVLQIKSQNTRDKVVAFGELISAIYISEIISSQGLHAIMLDAREFIFTKNEQAQSNIDLNRSQIATHKIFNKLDPNQIPIITGYIAHNEHGETVTLGRNGSNYSASLIASFINAKEIQNWTDVNGVYSGDPRHVSNAVQIQKMSYKEANEMANFGMNLLHTKTIAPLIKSNIPLHIKSLKEPNAPGTLIDKDGGAKGIKAVSSIKDVALITIAGNQMKNKVGIDGRIFSSLQAKDINIIMISQASSENGIGFVISINDVKKAKMALFKEFKTELNAKEIHSININSNIGIVVVIGRHNFALEKAISTLRKNDVWMHLINNSISGEHISLVVDNHKLNRAINLVHNEVFGTVNTLHVFAFGLGNVGAEFINQVLMNKNALLKKRKLAIKIIGVCNSQKYYLNDKGIKADWQKELDGAKDFNDIDLIIDDIEALNLNNIIIVDNTASEEMGQYYEKFIKKNYDIVASNKQFNASQLKPYKKLRSLIARKGRKFHYEANVGAALPIISTLKNMYNSSDEIKKIRGVFSGSLSYIFNNFSVQDLSFSTFLEQAINLGYAEADPRIDLSGKDVARKLVILAREVNCHIELDDVQIENLIPEELRTCSSYLDFQSNIEILDQHYAEIKGELGQDKVLRYVAEFDNVAQVFSVGLQFIKKSDPLANIKNADNYFEIYTDGFLQQPVILQGAGAGPKIIARAVYSDVLQIA